MRGFLETSLNWLRDILTSPVAIVTFTSIAAYKIYGLARQEYPTYDDEDYKSQGHVELPAPLQNLHIDLETLGKYNANNPNGTLLVAIDGVIYDVSSCRDDFGPNGSLKELPGSDIIWYIRKTAEIEGKDFDMCLQGWKNMLDDRFYVAGKLIGDEEVVENYNDDREQSEQSANLDIIL